jgi:hypothetical protein
MRDFGGHRPQNNQTLVDTSPDRKPKQLRRPGNQARCVDWVEATE